MRAAFFALVSLIVICAVVLVLFDRPDDEAPLSDRGAADVPIEALEDGPTGETATTADRRRAEPTMDVAVFLEYAREGRLPKVQQGIAQGIDPNVPGEQGRTALMLAAFDGHHNTVKYLLGAGADPNAKDEFGRTALMYAATGPHAATVETLLEAGADVNVVDEGEHFSALMFAAAEGHLDVVQLLLDHGADKSISDIDGETALDFARANGHPAVAELLQQEISPAK